MTYQEFFAGAYARLARDRVAERSTSGILDSARRAEALEADLHRRAAAQVTKEQTMITVKFTISPAGLYAMNSSHAAQKTFGICKVNGESTTNTKVSLEFKNVEDTEDFLRKLDLDTLVDYVEIKSLLECELLGRYFYKGDIRTMDANHLSRYQNKPVGLRIDWTKPLKHLGGLSVRYVDTLLPVSRFKHLCVLDDNKPALFDDHGQPEIGPFAVTNRPEVVRSTVGLTYSGRYHSFKTRDGVDAKENLALTWEDGKLIKAEVL